MDDFFDLRDFMFTILRGWRKLAVLFLIGLALGAGYKIVLPVLRPVDETEQKSISANYEQAVRNYDTKKTAMELSLLSLKYQEDRDTQDNVNALLMNLNPESSYQGVSVYHVATDLAKEMVMNSDSLAQIYLQMLNDTVFYEMLSEKIGGEYNHRAIRKIVSFSNLGNGLYQVVVLTADEQLCKDILRLTGEYAANTYSKVTALIGEHRFGLVRTEIAQGNGADAIISAQQGVLNGINDRVNAIQNTEIELEKLEPPKEIDSETIGDKVNWKSVGKFGALGAAGGMGLGFFIIFFIDAMGNRIYSAKDLTAKTKLKCLMDFTGDKEDAFHV